MNFKKIEPQMNTKLYESFIKRGVCEAYPNTSQTEVSVYERRFVKNEDAVSITVGFILTFAITVLVFSVIVISFYSLTQQSEKTAMRQSFEILGSGLAVRITMVDTIVNISNSYGGTVNALEYEFSIPAAIASKGYSVNMTERKIILESDNGAKSWIPFNTSTNFTGKEIYSSAQDYKLNYNKTDKKIEIKEQ